MSHESVYLRSVEDVGRAVTSGGPRWYIFRLIQG